MRQLSGGGGHQYLPGGLALAAFIAAQLPGKPRRRGVDSQRFRGEIAAQIVGRELGAQIRGGKTGGRQQKQKAENANHD